MENVLNTNGLTKRYGKNTVVDHVNMNIEKGDIYGFIGMNGAGKSTMMKMICGLAAPTSGEIKLYDSTNLTLGRTNIGAAIEQPALYPFMNAFDNMKYYAKLMGMTDDSRIREVLEIVGLSDTGKKKTKKFSLGMKQRLAIAISLLGDPDLLILDEPINGLDPSGIREVRELLIKLNQENHITILISSHILGELAKIATKYGVINKGKLVEEFQAADLEERCKHCIRIEVDDTKKAAFTLEKSGICHDYKIFNDNTICVYDAIDQRAVINQTLVNAGVMVSRLALEGQDLEAYFVKLMGGNEQ